MERPTLGVLVVLAVMCLPVAAQESIEGIYKFIQDSDGAKGPSELSITLTLSHGTATLVSTPPRPGYTDSGSYIYSGGKLVSFVLPRTGKFVRNGDLELENGVLTMPFKLMSSGAGASVWHEPKPEQSTAGIEESLGQLLDRILREYEQRVPLQVRSALLGLGGSGAESLLHSGTGLNMAGQIPESAYLLARSAKLSPEPQTLSNLGHVLSLDDEAALARGVLLFAKQAAPENSYIFNNLAFANYQLNRLQEAEMAARKAVALDPEPDFYWNLCKILHAEKKYVEAKTVCDEAYARGIKSVLYPGAHGDGQKPPDSPPPGDDNPPPPDGPPDPDNPGSDNRGPDLEGPASNEDEAAERAPDAGPDETIIGQIGKRDRANDMKEPKPYKFPSNPKPLKDLSARAAEWVGHWEGDKVVGCINRLKDFGQGLATTKVHENLCHYAQKISFDVDERGNIKGKGEAVYVIYDKADMVATMMLPLPLPPGGFFATFPGGYRVRKFDIKGTVLPDGTVHIAGRPTKPMYLLNVYMYTKLYGWNVFPPPADAPGKPGLLQIGKRDGVWVMEAVRKNVVSGMNYQTLVYKTGTKRTMAKGCRVFCDKTVELKDGPSDKVAQVKCSAGAGPVKIKGNSEQLEVEVNTGAIATKIGANYGKRGDIDKLIKAQQVQSCMAPEKGVNEKAGTEKLQMTAQNIGFSNERNPITGDETFGIGVMDMKTGVGKGKVKGEVKWGFRLIVNSRCGVGVRFNITEAAKAEAKLGSVSGGCSAEREQQATVWASSTIMDN